MTTLLEQPLPILIVGILVCAGFAAGLYSTGRVWMLWGLIAVALVTAALLALEHYVETDVEQVENEIYATANAIQSNDIPAVLDHISPQATETRNQAEAAMSQADVESVSVKSNLKVVVDAARSPPQAEASFNCVVSGAYRGGFNVKGPKPLFFRLRLRKEGERWLITGYEMLDPREGF